jgi:diacylglycerol kinase family enzyme
VKKLYSGRHLELPEAQVMRAKQVEISSRGKLLGEVEGEMLETGNYRIRIADRPLNVMSNFVDKKS